MAYFDIGFLHSVIIKSLAFMGKVQKNDKLLNTENRQLPIDTKQMTEKTKFLQYPMNSDANVSDAENSESCPKNLALPRRDFIKLIASTSIISLPLIRSVDSAWGAAQVASPSFRAKAVRVKDFLDLTFEFINFEVKKTGGFYFLRKIQNNNPSFINIIFPPQHIAEPGFTSAKEAIDSKIMPHLSGYSRLSFQIPENILNQLIFNLENILEVCKTLPMNLMVSEGHANSPEEFKDINTGLPDLGNSFPTIIEIPTQLYLSPTSESRWEHTGKIHSHQDERNNIDWCGIWNTRLVARKSQSNVDFSMTDPQPLRAIGYENEGGAVDLPQNPAAIVRKQAVGLTKRGFKEINAHSLVLSTLGGSINSILEYEPQRRDGYDLKKWGQRSVFGRDNYVITERVGYLFPFGHKAIYTKISERVVVKEPDQIGERLISYLRERHYLKITTKNKIYFSGSQNETVLPKEGRKFPFKEVGIDREGNILIERQQISDISLENAFIPILAREKNEDNLERLGTLKLDTEHKSLFSEGFNSNPKLMTPVIWVSKNFHEVTLSENQTEITKIRQAYQNEQGQNGLNAGNKKIFYAPPSRIGQNSTEETTAFETTAIFFDAEIVKITPRGDLSTELQAQYELPFLPFISRTRVVIPALKYLLGRDESIEVFFHEKYVEHNFPVNPATAATHPNKGEILFSLLNESNKLTKPPLSVNFSEFGSANISAPDVSLGPITPDLRVVGISRVLGPVSVSIENETQLDKYAEEAKKELENLANGTLDPKKFFKDAKLFGRIPLSTLLENIINFDSNLRVGPNNSVNQNPNAPVFRTRIEKTNNVPDKAVSEFLWGRPVAQNNSEQKLITCWKNDDSCERISVKPGEANRPAYPYLSLECRTEIPFQRSEPKLTTEFRLEKFQLNLFPNFDLLRIKFNYVSYKTVTGNSSKVDVDVEGVEFGGALEFVKSLSAALNPTEGQQSRLPKIKVSKTEISALFRFPIRTIAVGAYTLQNLSIAIGFHIPLNGQKCLALEFQISERRKPFTLSAGIYGGGGWFKIIACINKIEFLELGLEFGGVIALDVAGLATGCGSAMAGIYTTITEAEGTTLGGYFRAGGNVRVIGLINVSQVIYHGLRYNDRTNEVVGEVTVTYEVSMLFFSATVELHYERKFAGDSGQTATSQANVPNNNYIASLQPFFFLQDSNEEQVTMEDFWSEDDFVKYAMKFA
jgi:hypothetical protein